MRYSKILPYRASRTFMSLIWVLFIRFPLLDPFIETHKRYHPTDTIDISNLNRQFLFRQEDVGKSKAQVAAEFIMKRVKNAKITPYYGAIQDKGEDYYMQFNIVVCGLDSVEARRWINATLVDMVDMDNPDSLKPLIDGGTEGMQRLKYIPEKKKKKKFVLIFC